MNIYLVERTAGSGYDTYASFVAAAATEEEVRRMHPRGRPITELDIYDYTWMWLDEIHTLRVTRIGIADPSVDKAIVYCAKFNPNKIL